MEYTWCVMLPLILMFLRERLNARENPTHDATPTTTL